MRPAPLLHGLLDRLRHRRAPRRAGAAAWPAPDFAPRRSHAGLVGWALAATGALVLGTAGWDAHTLDEATAAAQQDLSRWERAARRQGPAVAKPAAQAAATEPARRRAWQIAAALGHPWPALFAATDAPAEAGLQWQRLQHDAASGEVLIEGRTVQPLAALPLVERLTQQPGWRDVVLVRLEQRGADGARFEIHASVAGQETAP